MAGGNDYKVHFINPDIQRCEKQFNFENCVNYAGYSCDKSLMCVVLDNRDAKVVDFNTG